MKILTKDFSTNEKILIAVLLAVILSAAYYLFVYRTVDENINALVSDRQALESQLQIVTEQVERLEAMSQQLGNDTVRSYMPSYNSSKKELDFLNGTLSGTDDYMVNFTTLTRNGDQINRGFKLQFTAKNFAQAENIFKTLEDSEIRCLIGDYIINPIEDDEHLLDGQVQVVLNGSFYETMYDGVADKELPEDEAKEQ
ncbi:MAG: hypothetical protein IJU77_04510 [Butyrivibrio sp.]|nr:hypothetical protein [Butyrivibrio sp.]